MVYRSKELTYPFMSVQVITKGLGTLICFLQNTYYEAKNETYLCFTDTGPTKNNGESQFLHP